MQLILELPEVYQPLVEDMLKANSFENSPDGMLALLRSSLKDHAKTLANRYLENRKFQEAQDIVDKINNVNTELFPPATAKATQLVFVQRKKKGDISWEVKEFFVSKGAFYESINPDGSPGREGTKVRGSLTEMMASEILV